MNLYVNNKEVSSQKTLEGFLRRYYKLGTPPTYNSEECNLVDLQCQGQCNRSFEDMYNLCKTYFPETTHKDIAKLWVKFNNDGWLEVFYCYDICKWVSYYDCDEEAQPISEKDIYDIEKVDNTGWSLEMIYDLAKEN